MAATMSPWSKPGAWALDAEEHEAELLNQQNQAQNDVASASDFPTLTNAAATKSSKKKKKGQTVTLAEFSSYSAPKPSAEPTGLTHEDRLVLPKGPRERTEEELRNSRGVFRSFDGGVRGGGEGGGRDGVRDLGPSRADEANNWASGKKSSVIPNNGYDRRDSGRDKGGFFDSPSEADESDSWFSNKSYAPPPPSEGRRFDRDRRGSGGGFGSSNGGSDSDFWGKKREETNSVGSESGVNSGRPRLNLQPRPLPVASNGGLAPVGPPAKPKGANPFGAARPREEVLAEKGQDWKKIDEQLDSMKIKEASERTEGGGSGGFGKRSFGSGNGRRSSLHSSRAETHWRKPEANGDDNDAASQSTEQNQDELAEEEN